jgi:hypothetical protein
VCDAFLGALGKHLAVQAGLQVPDALETEPARSWLRREALPGFRERNLFIDESALARL